MRVERCDAIDSSNFSPDEGMAADSLRMKDRLFASHNPFPYLAAVRLIKLLKDSWRNCTRPHDVNARYQRTCKRSKSEYTMVSIYWSFSNLEKTCFWNGEPIGPKSPGMDLLGAKNTSVLFIKFDMICILPVTHPLTAHWTQITKSWVLGALRREHVIPRVPIWKLSFHPHIGTRCRLSMSALIGSQL